MNIHKPGSFDPWALSLESYLACTNHILYANQIAISKESYDALPAEYQQALEQSVAQQTAPQPEAPEQAGEEPGLQM